MKIVVVGSSNTDMIVKVPRIPKPGETILGGTFATAAGGKGANQAVAAARAGGDVTFIARLGDDMFGRQARLSFEADHINVDHVKTDADEPSGVALIFVDEKGENSVVCTTHAKRSCYAKVLQKSSVSVILQRSPSLLTIRQSGCEALL